MLGPMMVRDFVARIVKLLVHGMKNVVRSHFTEGGYLFCAGEIVPGQLGSHQIRNGGRHSDGCPRIQEQRAGAPSENVFDGTSHFVPHRPDYFSFYVGKSRIQRLAERGIIFYKLANFSRV